LHLFRQVEGEGAGKSRLARIEVPVARVEPLRQELLDFVASVRTRRPPMVSGEAGREAVALATQIIERL
jgi:predicted dehydrogenase